MKYLILIIAFLAASCEQSSYKVENYISNNDIPFRRIAHFEYRNHKYIFFETNGYKSATAGVVHDPECGCFKHDSI